MQNSTIIEVRNLYKYFGDIMAVDDLSFTVNRGDIYGMLGINGSGKSTVLRMLLSLISPDRGRISLLGENLDRAKLGLRRRMGALIERPDFYNYLSARKNLEILLRCSDREADPSRILESLERVGLKKFQDKKVGIFSQGMKQRLGIAQALIHDPELLILDEPANGLDPHGLVDIRNLILELNREQGKTILLSSHILKEVEMMATRMLVIHEGKAMAEGSVNALLSDHEYTVRLVVGETERAFDLLGSSKYASLVTMEDNALICRVKEPEVPAIIRQLSDQGIAIKAVVPVKSLEEFFIRIT